MHPYLKFLLKSVTVFGSGLSLTGNALAVTKVEFGWVLFFAPAIAMLLSYWGGVADAMPAPWAQAEHARAAEEAVIATRIAETTAATKDMESRRREVGGR
jgi:hypothetical protein